MSKIRFRPPEYDPYTLLLDAYRRNMSNPRDTQFRGFAKLLFDKLYDQFNALRYLEYDMAGLGRDKEVEQAKQGILDTIAEAGYSLARHAAFHIDEQACDVLGFEGAMHRIPDMTEWHRED